MPKQTIPNYVPTWVKMSALPSRVSKVMMARSSLAATGLTSATALHMYSLFGTSTHWKESGMNGRGWMCWYTMVVGVASSVTPARRVHYSSGMGFSRGESGVIAFGTEEGEGSGGVRKGG